MIHFSPSLSQASNVAATDLFATSTCAQSEPELMALAAPGDGPAAFLKAENTWGRGGLFSICLAQS